MAFNFNQITKAVKFANKVKDPKQAVNMLIDQIEKKNSKLGQELRVAINSGKNPSQYIREQADNGIINMDNFNEVKKYYILAQKFGLTHKIDNKEWVEIEQAIKNKSTDSNNNFTFRGF